MIKHESKGSDLLVITFDDEQTTMGLIMGELKKGEIAFIGEPFYLK